MLSGGAVPSGVICARVLVLVLVLCVLWRVQAAPDVMRAAGVR